MINLKLYNLLETFSDKEVKEFKKLISSPLYSGNRNYTPLLNYIIRLQRKNKKKLSPDEIYSRLISKNKLKKQTFKNRFSELYKLGEEYLIYKSVKENKETRDITLINELHNRKLHGVFENSIVKTLKELNALPHEDTKFLNILLMDRLHLNYIKEKKLSENSYKKYYEHSEYVTSNFLINLFTFGIELIQQEQSGRKYEFNLVFEILDRLNFEDVFVKIKKSDAALFKIVSLQYSFYKIFRYPQDEKSYFEGKKIFYEVQNSLGESFKSEQYKLMTYYCITRQNEGIKKFQNELFVLYNEILKLNLYKEGENKKVFPVNKFRNHVLIGILMKKLKWTEQFIKKYAGELPEKNREDELNMAYSKLFFADNNYKKSLEYLNKSSGDTYMHYFDAAVLRLCIYYETEKFEDAFSEMDKLKHYLKNHKGIHRIHKEYGNNFLYIYLKLLKIKTGVEIKDVSLLERQAIETKIMSRREWLLEKIKQLSMISDEVC